MSLKKWKTLSSEVVIDNGYWKYKKNLFEIESGEKGEYHFVYSPGSTMVIPIDEAGNILLVEQYRYLTERVSLEFPCGGQEENLTAEQNAIKELREECGFSAKNLTYVSEFAPFNGVSNEFCKVFIATGLEPAPLPPDFTEEFKVHKFTVEEVEEMIKKHDIWDGMTLACWLMGKNTVIKIVQEL